MYGMQTFMGITRRHVFITGKVQGVGFRRSARSRALELGLTGWGRNLPDRRVELCFQRRAADEMENWCRTGSHFSRVTGISVSLSAQIEDETGFEIR